MVARIIDDKAPEGERAEVRRLLALGEKRDRYLQKHRGALVRLYPDEWIAVGASGVLAHSKSRAAVLRLTRTCDDPSVVLRRLDTRKRKLIL